MYEYKCENCGMVKYAQWPSYIRRFCTYKCATEWAWKNGKSHSQEDYDMDIEWERKNRRWICPYANFVSCTVRNCKVCGWHPDVAKARSEAIEKKRKEALA